MTTIATYAGVTALASVKFMVAVGTAVALRFGFVEQLVTTAGGAIVGVVVTAYAGDAIRGWWRRFRKRDGEPTAPTEAKGWQKALFERWGIVGLAVVGPPTLGPVFTVALALAFGATRHRATIVIASAVLVWGVIFAALSGWLQRFFG